MTSISIIFSPLLFHIFPVLRNAQCYICEKQIQTKKKETKKIMYILFAEPLTEKKL